MVGGCDRLGPVADAGRAGVAVLALGTVQVDAPSVTASSVIFLTPQTAPLALPYVSSKTPGAGFTITSLSVTDTATVGWLIVETQ